MTEESIGFMSCRIEKKNKLELLFFQDLEQMRFVRHAVFLQLDAALFSQPAEKSRSAYRSDPPSPEVDLLREAGLPAEMLVTLQQVHGTACHLVKKGDAATINGSHGDCLIASEPSIAIAVKTADCFPILLTNAKERAVACIHAGWRGIALGIVESCLERMSDAFSCSAEDAIVAIGPGIDRCCYEVKDDAIELFKSRHVDVEKFLSRNANGAKMLSLREIIIDKFLRAGVPGDRISHTGLCTFCSALSLPSFRREGHISRKILSSIMFV